MTADAESIVGGVRHAGAVFLGEMAPASLGDYIAGPSHVLPTNGTARFGGALGLEDFTKDVHIVSVTDEAMQMGRPSRRSAERWPKGSTRTQNQCDCGWQTSAIPHQEQTYELPPSRA